MAARGRRPIVVLPVQGRLDACALPGLRILLRLLVDAAGAEVVLCDVHAAHPDAATVDALARLRLAARRRGSDLRLLHASPELRELLDLAGLCEALPQWSLRGEAGGQPEEREKHVGVEEEGELGDAAVG